MKLHYDKIRQNLNILFQISELKKVFFFFQNRDSLIKNCYISQLQGRSQSSSSRSAATSPRSRSQARSGSPQASFITAASFCATGSQAASHSADSAFWVACGEEASDGRTSQGVCSKHTASQSLVRLGPSDGGSPKQKKKKKLRETHSAHLAVVSGTKSSARRASRTLSNRQDHAALYKCVAPAANIRFTMQLL